MSKILYRFYLLEKEASDYTFVLHEEVQCNTTDSVTVIEDAARTAINAKLRLPSAVGVKLNVYEPPAQFGDHDMTPLKLRRKLMEIFDDKYRNTCLRLFSDEVLEEIEFKEHLVVVFDSLEFRFFLFNQYNYFAEGELTTGTHQTVKAIMDEARKRIAECTWPNVDIKIVRVIEPKESLLEAIGKQNQRFPEDYDCPLSTDYKSVAVHGAGALLREIVGKDRLVIEFELSYFSVLFEKSGSSYTCLGSYELSVPAKEGGTVNSIRKGAREHVKGTPQPELFETYQLVGKHEDSRNKSPREIQEEFPINDGYLRDNAIYRPPQLPLQALGDGLLVIIFDNGDDGDRKRLLGTIEEEPNIKREKVVEAARNRKSPSDDAKPGEFHAAQTSARRDAVRNERPVTLTGHPIQIYHPVFAKFLSRAFSPFSGDEKTLEETSDFINASRQCYRDETTRIKALRPYLSSLIHIDAWDEKTVPLDGKNYFKPDATIQAGCSWGPTRPICAFIEVKNEVGTGGCDPALQCQSDFVKLCTASTYKPIVGASCCPVFLVAIAGPHLLVAGAVLTNTFIAQELTDYLTLGSHPTDSDRGLRRVAQVLVTLRECIQDLDSFYRGLEFVEGPSTANPAPSRGSKVSGSQGADLTTLPMPKSPLGDWVFPCHTEFKVGDVPFTLTYKGPLAHGEKTTRALFTASMKSQEAGKLVVVKFTRRYCPEAHKVLAGMSLAPQLEYHADIAGVHFVVMECLKATEDTGEVLKSTRGSKHVESLRRAVRALHGAGLVFGDLREPNILITEGGVKLVDFDWSGKEGQVHYPIDIAPRSKIPWPEGVRGEGKIRAEHDKQWFSWLTGTEL